MNPCFKVLIRFLILENNTKYMYLAQVSDMKQAYHSKTLQRYDPYTETIKKHINNYILFTPNSQINKIYKIRLTI
jgi:hypothetical protein